MFNYNHLYYFYVTAKLGGVTSAARQLKTSQPSLSAQIKNLEKSFNRELFRKNGRQMELTEEGHRVYSFCKPMFELAEELEEYANGKDALKRLRVSIGVSSEIERPFIANYKDDASRDLDALSDRRRVKAIA
jgi:LysR family transcriptional activator of nhaA